MNDFKRPSMRSHPRHFFGRLLRNWTLPLWLALLVFTAYLFASGAQLSGFSGVVEAFSEPIAPIETARLVSLDVKPGDRVKAGQVVARMDRTVAEAEASLQEADLKQMELNIARFQQSVLDVERQFAQAVSDAEADLQADRLDKDRDKAELDALCVELKRREDLVARRVIPDTDLGEIRPRIAALERSMADYDRLLKIREERVAEAKRNVSDVAEWFRLEGVENAASAIQKRVNEWQAIIATNKVVQQMRFEAFNLKTTREGIVAEFFKAPGDVVDAGEPIVRLVDPSPEIVAGFLPDHHLHAVKVGQKMKVYRRGLKENTSYDAVVESIAPDVQALPGRFSPIRGQPLRGRRINLRIQGPHDLLPGETVQITSGDTLWNRWKGLWQKETAEKPAA